MSPDGHITDPATRTEGETLDLPEGPRARQRVDPRLLT
jgi:hypothetical protein